MHENVFSGLLCSLFSIQRSQGSFGERAHHTRTYTTTSKCNFMFNCCFPLPVIASAMWCRMQMKPNVIYSTRAKDLYCFILKITFTIVDKISLNLKMIARNDIKMWKTKWTQTFDFLYLVKFYNHLRTYAICNTKHVWATHFSVFAITSFSSIGNNYLSTYVCRTYRSNFSLYVFCSTQQTVRAE